MLRLFALLSIALLAACATPATLPSGEWTLISAEAVKPTIALEGDRASGFAGCNRFFATVTRADGHVSLTGIGATRMFCEGRMQIEQDYLAKLGQVAAVQADGAELSLRDAEGRELLRFSRAP